MSAVNFPDPSESPWYNPDNKVTYEYNNGVWKAVSGGFGNQDLQSVTDNGNVTTNGATFASDKLEINTNGSVISKPTAGSSFYAYNGGTGQPNAIVISSTADGSGINTQLAYDGSAKFAGNVGVGDPSPLSTLSVLGAGAGKQLRLMRKGATSDVQTSGIVFGNDFSTNGLGILGSADGGFQFRTTTDTSADLPLGSGISTTLVKFDSDGSSIFSGTIQAWSGYTSLGQGYSYFKSTGTGNSSVLDILDSNDNVNISLKANGNADFAAGNIKIADVGDGSNSVRITTDPASGGPGSQLIFNVDSSQDAVTIYNSGLKVGQDKANISGSDGSANFENRIAIGSNSLALAPTDNAFLAYDNSGGGAKVIITAGGDITAYRGITGGTIQGNGGFNSNGLNFRGVSGNTETFVVYTNGNATFAGDITAGNVTFSAGTPDEINVRERIINLVSRLDAIESNEIIDDATDTSLLQLLANASARLDSIEARLAALEGGN